MNHHFSTPTTSQQNLDIGSSADENDENEDPNLLIVESTSNINFNSGEWSHNQWRSGRRHSQLFNEITYNGRKTNLLVCTVCLANGSSWIRDKQKRSTIRAHYKHHLSAKTTVDEASIRKCAIEVIIKDGRPMSMFEGEAMQRFIETVAQYAIQQSQSGLSFNANAILPSHQTIARGVNEAAERLFATPAHQSFIAAVREFGALTLDLGLKGGRNFFVITASAITNEFHFKSAVLALIPLPIGIAKSTVMLQHLMAQALQPMQIDPKKMFITTDEGSNLLGLAARERTHRCECHFGALICKRAVHSYRDNNIDLMEEAALNEVSDAMDALHYFIADANKNHLNRHLSSLRVACPTRWSDNIRVARHFVKNFDAIVVAVQQSNDDELGRKLNRVDRAILQHFLDVTTPLEDYVESFENDSKPMADQILLRRASLIRHLRRCEEEGQNEEEEQQGIHQVAMARGALTAIARKHQKFNMDFALAAAFVNPSSAKLLDRISRSFDGICGRVDFESAKSAFLEMFDDYEHAPPYKKSRFDVDDDEFVHPSFVTILQSEVAVYTEMSNNMEAIPEEFDVLDFWSKQTKQLPKMASAARQLLSRSASSAASERAFSIVSWLMADPRRSKADLNAIASTVIVHHLKDESIIFQTFSKN